MEESKIDEDLPPKKKKFNILTNPTVMGWIAIIGLPLTVWGYFQLFASEKEAKPVYSVVSNITITKGDPKSKIKVFYDSVEVKDVRAVNIAIWNAGQEFLDKQAFSKDRPLSIRSNKKVRILETKVLATTRPSLNISELIQTNKQKWWKKLNQIYFSINGDEGFEAGDGVLIQILYTGEGDWIVDGRIKGIPKGFVKMVDPEVGLMSWIFVLYGAVSILLTVLYFFLLRIFKINKTVMLAIFIIILFYECYGAFLIGKKMIQSSAYEPPPKVLRDKVQQNDSTENLVSPFERYLNLNKIIDK